MEPAADIGGLLGVIATGPPRARPGIDAGAGAGTGARFDQLLGRASGDAFARTDDEQLARQSAEQLVASVFVEPVLAQLRETNRAAPPFAPTRGEQMFNELLDRRLAEDIVKAGQFPLVDRVARDLLHAGGSPATARAEGVLA